MITLYNWQEEALEIGIKHVEAEENSTFAAVTGSGKTLLATRIAEHVLALGWHVTIIVPRKALMTQWREDLPMDAGRIGGGSIKGWPQDGTQNVTIATINSMRDGKGRALGGERHLVIVDECHNLRGAKNRNALSQENCPHTCVVGLSATPHPTEKDKEVVESLCGPIRYTYRYGQALADGVIPPFVLHAIQIPMDAEEQREHLIISDKIKGVMKEANREWGAERNRLMQIAKMMGLKRKRLLNACRSRFHIALRILNHHGKDAPTLLFHDTIEGVERMSQMTGHLNPAVYHCKTKKGSEQIERFTSAETNHLYSCLALTEGFNVPRVQKAIMMSGPNAPLRRIQTLGRCLRGKAEEPNEIFFFYVKGTKDEMGLHNLLTTADIPESIKVNGDTIKVVHHWCVDKRGSPVAQEGTRAAELGIHPVEPPIHHAFVAKQWSSSGPQHCEKCGRDFRSEVGLNNHHCVKSSGRVDKDGNRIVRSWEDIFGPTPETFDEFMEGFEDGDA